ncbi:hypothetical protein H072_10520 [Dactylellina haptotyla CBS 200.50]|uniref:Uncharacterized protein n=1 Tax=Dactylellina haptotyla (strain CBS 200.50) TaxID=1284197 RepID=S8BAF0_DACHA|nr:hypothetical protein H072_10520 [Dactylellina haptotyla CBS 200.50]
MARKARQKISYVLPLPNSPGGHRLGVNSLALDRRGTLYSAGRDGVICAWDIQTDLTTPPDPSLVNGESPTSRPRPPPSTFKSQVQAHTHWVNDLALTADSESVVSCSSDLTVKLWRPASKEPPADLGNHSDYVKCVVASGSESKTSGTWVASGGLDRKIFLWDLSGQGEQSCIDVGDGGDKDNPKGSVYSLGIGGGILASGGPESVVRLWDPRSGKSITKFVGHTDLVRSILISEDANIILSASSDATVKMWSVTGGRCLHTLTMHNDSVWSLHSSHPQLELFHSADRTGLVAKTDIRNIGEIEEGICVAVCQETEGVNKVIADGGFGDYIWTATSSSRIHRWLDVDTNAEIAPPPKEARSPALPSLTHAHQHRPSNASIATVVGYPKKSNKPMIQLNSILKLSNTSAFTSHEVRDPDEVTIYSIPQARHASITEAMMGVEDTGDTTPIYEQPDETIEGQNGLIKHILLNDRRRVLTVDSAGDVLEWDLVKCTVLKKWGKRHIEDVQREINPRENIANWCQVDTRTGRLACVLEENYCFDAEMYADEVESEEKIEFRDDHRINLGKWVLRYLFSNLIDEEIRRDEDYRKELATAQAAREAVRRQNAPSAIILPGPPSHFQDASPSATTPRPGMNGMSATYPATPGMSIGLATPAIAHFPTSTPGGSSLLPPMAEEDPKKSTDSDYFSTIPAKSKDDELTSAAPTPALPATTPGAPATTATEETAAAPVATSKLSLSKFWSKKSKQTEEKKTEEPKPEEPAEPVKQPEQFDDTLAGVIKRIRQSYEVYSPDRLSPDFSIKTAIGPSLPSETPVLKHPPEMVVIIQEDSPDSGGMKDVYRGTVGDVGAEADELEKVLPGWVAEAILLNKVPMKEVVKVSFVLVPWKDKLASIGDINDPNNRLNANRMLRARKIVTYIYDRLDPLPAQAGGPGTDFGEEKRKPEDWLELMVKDEVIPLNMTLATMKAHVWRTGGDVVVHYRIKGGEDPIERRKVVVVEEEKTEEESSAPAEEGEGAKVVDVPDVVEEKAE